MIGDFLSQSVACAAQQAQAEQNRLWALGESLRRQGKQMVEARKIKGVWHPVVIGKTNIPEVTR